MGGSDRFQVTRLKMFNPTILPVFLLFLFPYTSFLSVFLSLLLYISI